MKIARTSTTILKNEVAARSQTSRRKRVGVRRQAGHGDDGQKRPMRPPNGRNGRARWSRPKGQDNQCGQGDDRFRRSEPEQIEIGSLKKAHRLDRGLIRSSRNFG